MSDGPRRIHTGEVADEHGYDTIEEAIAAAMAELGPGGVVAIHDGNCEQNDADESKCTCEPLELVLGAQA